MATTMEASMFIIFNMFVCVHMHACVCCMYMYMYMYMGVASTNHIQFTNPYYSKEAPKSVKKIQ